MVGSCLCLVCAFLPQVLFVVFYILGNVLFGLSKKLSRKEFVGDIETAADIFPSPSTNFRSILELRDQMDKRFEHQNKKFEHEIAELRRGRQQSVVEDALGGSSGAGKGRGPTLYYSETAPTTTRSSQRASAERSLFGTMGSSSSSKRVQSSGASRHGASSSAVWDREDRAEGNPISGSGETETLIMGKNLDGGSLRYGSIGGASGGPGTGHLCSTAGRGDSVSGLRSRAVTREEPFRDGERHPVRREQQGEEPGERF